MSLHMADSVHMADLPLYIIKKTKKDILRWNVLCTWTVNQLGPVGDMILFRTFLPWSVAFATV